MNLIIFILVCFGLTNAIVREGVFAWLRNWIDRKFPYSMLRELIHCETCVSFYVGIGIALLFPYLGLHWLVAGLLASASIKIICIILLKF